MRNLPSSFLPFFSTLEKYVFAALIILYPSVVLAKKNFGNIVAIFVLFCCSGFIHALIYNAFLFDAAVVFIVYLVGFLGFKAFYDSWKCKSEKKAWNMMGLGFLVFVLMWACLQLLAVQIGL